MLWFVGIRFKGIIIIIIIIIIVVVVVVVVVVAIQFSTFPALECLQAAISL